MNKLALVAATALTAGLSLSAQAQYNSHAEARGYDQCLEAAQAELTGLTPKREYYIAKQEDTNVYYINGWAWQGDERTDVRVYCETTPNGRRLVEYSTASGRYAVADQGRGEAIAASE